MLDKYPCPLAHACRGTFPSGRGLRVVSVVPSSRTAARHDPAVLFSGGCVERACRRRSAGRDRFAAQVILPFVQFAVAAVTPSICSSRASRSRSRRRCVCRTVCGSQSPAMAHPSSGAGVSRRFGGERLIALRPSSSALLNATFRAIPRIVTGPTDFIASPNKISKSRPGRDAFRRPVTRDCRIRSPSSSTAVSGSDLSVRRCPESDTLELQFRVVIRL